MNAILSLCMISLLFLGGCGKRKYKTVETKTTAALDVKTDAKVTKLAQSTPADDLVEEESDSFAFVDDEEEKGADVLQKAEVTVDGESTLDLASNESEITTAQADTEEFQPIRFEFNKNVLKPNQDAVLKKDINLAKNAAKEGKKVVIQGHTCQMGDSSFNMALSLNRAQKIKQEMINGGVPAQSVEAVGLGNEYTIVSTDATNREEKIAALAPNRRASIVTTNA